MNPATIQMLIWQHRMRLQSLSEPDRTTRELEGRRAEMLARNA